MGPRVPLKEIEVPFSGLIEGRCIFIHRFGA